jgi:uncharacterized protein (TIGR02145 family)
MLTPGYTSVERVIENVIRDTGFTTEINWVDIIEWVYIATELIGVKNAYVLKVTDGNTTLGHPDAIEIVDYRGTLPTDFHMVQQIRESNSKLALRADSNSFLLASEQPDNYIATDLTYSINNDYIFTSFQEGTLEMSYYAYPTGTDGLPLIPDDVMYIRAIESYITERIARKLWLQDKLTDGKYKALEQDWLFYVNSARTKDSLMTVDQAESFKNQIVRIATKFNAHSSTFRELNYPERSFIRKSRISQQQPTSDTGSTTVVIEPTEIHLGLLYNWYAMTNVNLLAPANTHIPTYVEIQTLHSFIEGNVDGGGKLKSMESIYWQSPNIGATDEYGFKAIGNGSREVVGISSSYTDIKLNTAIASSVQVDASLYYGATMVNSADTLTLTGASGLAKVDGHPVRCLLDNPLTWYEGMLVADIDGNLYGTCQIGTQVWLTSNLKVTKYNNSSLIPQVTDATAWAALTTGAYCVYDNDLTNI